MQRNASDARSFGVVEITAAAAAAVAVTVNVPATLQPAQLQPSHSGQQSSCFDNGTASPSCHPPSTTASAPTRAAASLGLLPQRCRLDICVSEQKYVCADLHGTKQQSSMLKTCQSKIRYNGKNQTENNANYFCEDTRQDALGALKIWVT